MQYKLIIKYNFKNTGQLVFQKQLLKINFFIFLNRFEMLILKIIFKK